MIDPNKVIDDAQHLLKKAVNVLEEEIAAGILAAKKMEKKVIDVDEMRDTNPEDLMSRIRRDTHDAVDILLDAFTALTRHFGGLTETLNKASAVAAQAAGGNGATSQSNGNGRSNGNAQRNGNARTSSDPHSKEDQAKTASNPAIIRAEKPAKPGSSLELPMSLTNDSKDQRVAIKLNKSELIGAGGSKIGARNIKLTPASFTLEPLQNKEVAIKITIPETCKPGLYSGLIQDDSNPDIRVILTIQIGKTKK